MSSLEPDDTQATEAGVLTLTGPVSSDPTLDDPPGDSTEGEPRSAAALSALVVGMLAAAVYRKGGFYPADAFGVAVVSGIVAVVALVRFKDRASAIVALAVGALAVWWMVRSVLVHHPAAFFPFGAALLGFLGAFVVVKALNDRDRGRVALAVVVVSAVTAVAGLAGVLWHISSLAQHSGGFWQLSTPLTDPAGAAGMFAVALLLALGLDLDAPAVRAALCVMLAGAHRDPEPLGAAGAGVWGVLRPTPALASRRLAPRHGRCGRRRRPGVRVLPPRTRGPPSWPSAPLPRPPCSGWARRTVPSYLRCRRGRGPGPRRSRDDRSRSCTRRG